MKSTARVFVIGVTGSFGTGKSTVAGMFEGLGATVLDADEISHRIIGRGTEAYGKIVRQFGSEVLDEDREIDRRELAQEVFRHRNKIKLLCDIIHPRVISFIRKRIRQTQKTGGDAVVVIDAPLLIEAGAMSLVNILVVVKATIDVQIARCMKRTGLSKSEILRRIRYQMPLKKKIRMADYVVDNSGTLACTRKQVSLIWERIGTEKHKGQLGGRDGYS
jgi:dephospho-CoA kinase